MGRRRRERYSYYNNMYGPYVSVGERRAKAAREAQKLAKKGHDLRPVYVEGRGRNVAQTFWGKAWCKNLESYSDYANRLPRGRSYVRHGAVLDLRIEPGEVKAKVSGTRIYTVEITIDQVPKPRWDEIVDQCAGEIDSVVELLQGKLSKGVMEIITRKGEGLFPSPQEIHLSCSCPDWAVMCKHVAATLYGVGVRLDEEPSLLFRLRQVDEVELIRTASDMALAGGAEESIAEDDLGDIFGIELDEEDEAPSEAPPKAKTPRKRAAKPKSPKKRLAKPKTTEVEAPARAKGTAKRSAKSAPKAKSIARRLGPPLTAKSATKPKRSAKKPEKTTLVPPPGQRIAAKELTAKGVPHSRIQSWLRAGVLIHSGDRGIYLTTKETEDKVREYLEG